MRKKLTVEIAREERTTPWRISSERELGSNAWKVRPVAAVAVIRETAAFSFRIEIGFSKIGASVSWVYIFGEQILVELTLGLIWFT